MTRAEHREIMPLDRADRRRPALSGARELLAPLMPGEEARACCQAARDALGRLPIGACSDECELHQHMLDRSQGRYR